MTTEVQAAPVESTEVQGFDARTLLAVTKEDIVNIAVSEIMLELQTALDTVERRRKSLDQELRGILKEISTRGEEEADKKTKALVENVSNALKNLGVGAPVIMMTTTTDHQENTITCRFKIKCSADDYMELKTTMVFPFTERMMTLAAKAEKLEEKLADAKERGLSLKKRLSEIDRVERKTRADLTKLVLQSTPAGKEFLESMLGKIRETRTMIEFKD